MSILKQLRDRKGLALASLMAIFAAACSSGGGGGSQEFQIVAVNLPKNFVGWEINREIRVSFNQPIDPNSVTNNTIQVRLSGGSPAFGTPAVDTKDPNTVVWRPLCPKKDDLSDAGLLSGVNPSTGLAFEYELNIIGADKKAGFTIRSVSGRALELSDTRTFKTPTSQLFSDLFVDTAVGAAQPVIRSALTPGQPAAATHLSVAGTLHYFERQANGIDVLLNPPLDLPLNLLSDPTSQVELFVQFNQSVDMRTANINSSRIRWEFETQPNTGLYQAITTFVTLEENCTDDGAVVKITPGGLLPPSTAGKITDMRVVVTTEFKDLIGEQNLLVQDAFAPATSEIAPAPLADHYLEEFFDNTNQDVGAPFAEPTAEWGSGELKAKFSFGGTGGPDGDFDWKIAQGEIFIFNTVSSTIQGGPGFNKQKVQQAIGGVIDVRDLLIEPGGILKCEGPNPVTILASGDVCIEGLLDLSGTNSPGVNTLNTTTVPEPGAPGQCGGGKGGTGSPLTTASSPRGGNGLGAFSTTDGGGQGGDTGWSNSSAINSRRGGGGGGGRLGLNVPDSNNVVGAFDQGRIGMDGEAGFDNNLATNGASTGAGPALGGKLGPSPFVDSNPLNDFFGTQFDTANNRLVVGELKQPWAGAGGGAGGDAARVKNGETFPQNKFNAGGDEKGAGGGGGGGSLQILALGCIKIGHSSGSGQILARGGTGGGGENTIFLNRVGGGSGAGSGGHVILQSATKIDLSQLFTKGVVATGGQGGAGMADEGGAFLGSGGMKETSPAKDACTDFQNLNASSNCKGPINGAGGDGSPGIVQLHTSTGVVGQAGSGADIILPATATTLADVISPPPICESGAGSCYMIPSFGRTSRSRSDWIALGDGGFDNSGAVATYKAIQFDFQGTDGSGNVMTDGLGNVLGLTALLTETSVLASGYSIDLNAVSMVGGPNDYLLQNPELMRHYLLELQDSSMPATNFRRFDVVSASFNSGTNVLTLQLDANGPALDSFQAGAPIDALLQPAFFRICTDGTVDSLPASAAVQIMFEATEADVNGNPTSPASVPLTADAGVLNSFMSATTGDNSTLRFVRFEVLFDIDVGMTGLTPNNPIPSAKFMRMPFQYP
jgi:hypothetical protein